SSSHATLRRDAHVHRELAGRRFRRIGRYTVRHKRLVFLRLQREFHLEVEGEVGGRSLPGRGASVVALVAPSLLGALVVYETVSTGGQGIELDARLAGLVAAAAALVLRLPLIAVVLVAAVATALTRLI
ncbi:MAG TPA: AzlD domain-containing protein, partial [Solirubrobacteraceae bacterium]